ncbi:MAG: hypothetical protein ACI9VR_005419 [Cognaticolwellia sp.]|jgi:hypothetical protein
MLSDALKGALGSAKDLEARVQPKAEKVASLVTELADSPWLDMLRDHGPVPADAGLSRLIDISNKLQKTLKGQGQGKAAKTLARLQSDAVGKLQKAAWAKIKQRFTELKLPEKSYRRLKQAKTDPHKLLAKLTTRRAESNQGAGDKQIKEWLG